MMLSQFGATGRACPPGKHPATNGLPGLSKNTLTSSGFRREQYITMEFNSNTIAIFCNYSTFIRAWCTHILL
jgi:hypothetical protein